MSFDNRCDVLFRLFFALVLLLPLTAFGMDPQSVEVELWARATAPGAGAGAAYGRIVNHSEETITLDRLETPAAGKTEVHETVMVGDMMRMQSRMPLAISPGQAIELEPGALHIMLMKLGGPLVAGSTFRLVLVFSGGAEVETEVGVGTVGQMEMPE